MLLGVGAVMLIAGCYTGELSESKVSDILEVRLPASDTGESTLIEIIQSINEHLKKNYPDKLGHSILIERHDNPNYDLGSEVPNLNLPAQTLSERIYILTAGTMTHWRKSENGSIIIKTWHYGNPESRGHAPCGNFCCAGLGIPIPSGFSQSTVKMESCKFIALQVENEDTEPMGTTFHVLLGCGSLFAGSGLNRPGQGHRPPAAGLFTGPQEAPHHLGSLA